MENDLNIDSFLSQWFPYANRYGSLKESCVVDFLFFLLVRDILFSDDFYERKKLDIIYSNSIRENVNFYFSSLELVTQVTDMYLGKYTYKSKNLLNVFSFMDFIGEKKSGQTWHDRNVYYFLFCLILTLGPEVIKEEHRNFLLGATSGPDFFTKLVRHRGKIKKLFLERVEKYNGCKTDIFSGLLNMKFIFNIIFDLIAKINECEEACFHILNKYMYGNILENQKTYNFALYNARFDKLYCVHGVNAKYELNSESHRYINTYSLESKVSYFNMRKKERHNSYYVDYEKDHNNLKEPPSVYYLHRDVIPIDFEDFHAIEKMNIIRAIKFNSIITNIVRMFFVSHVGMADQGFLIKMTGEKGSIFMQSEKPGRDHLSITIDPPFIEDKI